MFGALRGASLVQYCEQLLPSHVWQPNDCNAAHCIMQRQLCTKGIYIFLPDMAGARLQGGERASGAVAQVAQLQELLKSERKAHAAALGSEVHVAAIFCDRPVLAPCLLGFFCDHLRHRCCRLITCCNAVLLPPRVSSKLPVWRLIRSVPEICMLGAG